MAEVHVSSGVVVADFRVQGCAPSCLSCKPGRAVAEFPTEEAAKESHGSSMVSLRLRGMFLLTRRNESQAITDTPWWVLGEFFWSPFLNVDTARSEVFKSQMPARHTELIGKVRTHGHKPLPSFWRLVRFL
jgi:hypothetical protein